MSRFVFIDPARLPDPSIVQVPDNEAILRALKEAILARRPELADVLARESELPTILLEEAAFREVLIRQELNDAVKSLFPSTAVGSDLDLHGARFGVARLVLVEADPDANPPVEEVLESDADFRRRIALALEAFSTAGPEGAYLFHALGADPDVKDATVDCPTFDVAELSAEAQAELAGMGAFALVPVYTAGLAEPRPGDTVTTVLSRSGDGVPSAAVLDAVAAALNDEEVRPLTDRVFVRAAEVSTYAVEARLTLYPGPIGADVVQAAADAVRAYADEHHRLGHDITRSGLIAALHQPGVQNVDLVAPAADIERGDVQAAYCVAIDVTEAGRDV